ncbi:MAG: SsrA-binding protein SmpB [Spirochaetota bacterium]
MKKNKENIDTNNKVVAKNRKARHNYEILDTYEAGIVLQGTEVKSIREGNVNISDTFAKFLKGELYLVNMHISPYKQANIQNHEPTRSRKLLLHKGEMKKLYGKIAERGMTLVPLKIYLKNGLVKIELGLGKGKKEYKKKESEKRRDEKVKLQRILKEKQ